MEAWAYIERERGSEPNKQYFVEHYKLQEIPVIFIRDKVGAEGIGQNPKEDNPYNASRCITNCHQKFWGCVKFKGTGKLKYSTGDIYAWRTTSIFNRQENSNIYNSQYELKYWIKLDANIGSTSNHENCIQIQTKGICIHKGRKSQIGDAYPKN